LAALKEHVGHGGASSRAADYILDALDSHRRPALRTHYAFDTPREEFAREAA
jgi:hypothetical protein